MSGLALPRACARVVVPPVKCQGIKTKLVPFILGSVRWEGEGRWIEPFVGSGVVVLNVRPRRAVLGDTNPHVIALYRMLDSDRSSPSRIEQHLLSEGALLRSRGQEHYYAIRERFNATSDPLDFLFLNRASFNGLLRFNRAGRFNVPFCRKPDRFSRAYVTKIVNQARAVRDLLAEVDWEWRVTDWRATVGCAGEGDFVYCDPPYEGRHADYYDSWSTDHAHELAAALRCAPCGYALSTWGGNRHRTNPLTPWRGADVVVRSFEHFYHVGPTEDLRGAMTELLLVRRGFAAASEWSPPARARQLSLLPEG